MQMKKTNHQIKYILHKDVSITVKIKKYKYSRNYKVTYDKKNLQGFSLYSKLYYLPRMDINLH
jgi:hypothetical protein